MEGDGRGKRQRPEDAVPASPGAPEGEEEQVEKFFALLNSIRELREQRRRVGNSVPRKRPKVEGSARTPTFQREDFAVVSDNGTEGIPTVSTEGGRRGDETKEEDGTSLDLKLSL